MSIKQAIIDQAFGGRESFMRNVVKYDGTPNDNLTITATSPYGKGTLCYDYANNVVYYKTGYDATSWIDIDDSDV